MTEPYTKAATYGFTLAEIEIVTKESSDLQKSADIFSLMLGYSREHILLTAKANYPNIITPINGRGKKEIPKISPEVVNFFTLLDTKAVKEIFDISFMKRLLDNFTYNSEWTVEEIINLGKTKLPSTIRKDFFINWNYPDYWNLLKRFNKEQFELFYSLWNVAVLPYATKLLYYSYNNIPVTYTQQEFYKYFLDPELYLEGGYLYHDRDALSKITLYFCPTYNTDILFHEFDGSKFVEELIRNLYPNIAKLLYNSNELTEEEFLTLKNSTEPILRVSDTHYCQICDNELFKDVEIFGKKYKVKINSNGGNTSAK